MDASDTKVVVSGFNSQKVKACYNLVIVMAGLGLGVHIRGGGHNQPDVSPGVSG